MDFKAFLVEMGFNGYGLMIGQVFIIVLLTLVMNLVALKILSRIVHHAHISNNFWDDVLVQAARKPLGWLIWLIGISWAAGIVAAQSKAEIFNAIGPIREVSVIVLLTWFVVSFISRAQEALTSSEKREEPLDQTTAEAIGKLLRASVMITAALVMLQTLGFSISGVLAFGGIGGIAVGFAAKDLLANFFGGLMIYLDRPFVIGDWVRSPDQEIEGVVEKIGWRLTVIRTFEKRPLYVPNSTFTSITVENPSRMTNRRIYETIGLRYQDAAQLQAVINAVKEMLAQHPDIDTDNTLIVNFNAYGPSSLDFFIYAYTKTVNWVTYHEVKQDVLLKILAIIDQHDADIAYPTQTLHWSSMPVDEAVELKEAESVEDAMTPQQGD